LNSNINIFICFSFSKTLAIYGTRIAALIVLSNNSTKLQESILNNIKGKIFRTPTLGALIVTALFSNKTLLAQYKKELSGVKLMLKKRAELFMTEANSCKLDYIPYTSGFFITVPVNDPEKIISSMKEYSSVLRPQGKSLRVGICGMPLNTIKGIAKKIKSNI
jgi:aromatic-amino-acid transaminase